MMALRQFIAVLALAATQISALRPGGSFLASKVLAADLTSNGISALSEDSSVKSYNLSVPVDHFHNESKYEPHSNDFFNLRYLIDTTHYKPGGPVIILHSGEFDADGRLEYLEHGIATILAKATNGIGLILEHRYYGTSWPTNETDLKSYRWLTTDQALADTAYFSKNLKVPGLEHIDLTAPATPHILYGGSYAGGFVAFARKLYPDVFWGAISSSGVTVAIDDFWQYHEAARHFSPGNCSVTLQKLNAVIDKQLLSGNKDREHEIKDLFGLSDLWNDEFADAISYMLSSFQNTDWDPDRDSNELGTFCAVITAEATLFPSTLRLQSRVRSAVRAAEFSDEPLSTALLNYVGFMQDFLRKRKERSCKGKKNLRECLSSRLEENDETHLWIRSWTYQTCTEWGYFVCGASTPKDKGSMVSRALTAEYNSYSCVNYFNITSRPKVENINKYGGFNFSYPRLALIDGKQDPWRAAGTHAHGLPDRKSTASEPFELIDWGVHHWDENGLKPDVKSEPGLPPKQVVDIQQKEVDIVKNWLKQFEDEKNARQEM